MRVTSRKVSTEAQVNEPQILALQREGIETIITEVVSGAVPARARPKLSTLLGHLTLLGKQKQTAPEKGVNKREM